MLPKYYTLPLDCQKIISKQNLPFCGIADSIKQHIHLILRTHFNEYRFDPSFGCMVWDKDFETIRSIYKWKAELIEAFTRALNNYEKRLLNIQVVVELEDLKVVDPRTQKISELRKRITIHISGVMGQTNESFQHIEHIFFSPLSLT